MKKNFLKYSFWASVISIITTIVINLKISQDYFASTGKDRALFGLHEAFDYIYQYFVCILGIIAIVLLALYKSDKYQPSTVYGVGMLAFLSIIMVFAKIWRLFVWMIE